MSQLRILITGGMGFIGGRVAQHLAQIGHQVRLGSRNIHKSPAWLPDAEVVKTDWGDHRALEDACKGVNVVIHAAGMNAQDCAADPVAALESNGLTTARLVKAASKAGAKRLIYLSTAHVYSSPLVGTLTEETCPHNLHPYATSHLAGEHAVLSARQCHQLEGMVLRLSNVFGAPVHRDVNCWMLLISDICRQAARTGKIILHTNGAQQRDFISVQDVSRIIGHLSSRNDEPGAQDTFNVGSGMSLSVLEMAQIVQTRCHQILGFEPELQRPTNDVDHQQEILNFKIDRLRKQGLMIDSDYNAEIDKLLTNCQAWFAESPHCAK